jgi:hypothetical protein
MSRRRGASRAPTRRGGWRKVPCTTAPPYPMVPRNPEVVGQRDDVSLQAPAGNMIQYALGTFDSVTGVTSESGPINNTGPSVANAYSIQLNTNPFTSATACAASPNPMCQGWEQWVFASDGTAGAVFIQYWLLNFNAACPIGWNQFTFTPLPPNRHDQCVQACSNSEHQCMSRTHDSHERQECVGDHNDCVRQCPSPQASTIPIFCFRNSSGASVTPFEPITNLINLGLGGSVIGGGDSYFFVEYAPNTAMYAGSGDNLVNAAAGWNAAEFNVFGLGGGGMATFFDSGATIVSRLAVLDGNDFVAPNCVPIGFTGETNSLKFGPTAPAFVELPGMPSLVFMEGTAGGALSNCSAAATAAAAPVTPSKHDQCVQACGQGEQQCMSRTRDSQERQECVSDQRDCVRHCP